MPDRATPPGRVLVGAAWALSCDRVTAEVMCALRDAAVRAILLKGPSIAQWLYPAGGRSYADTDILVPGHDFDRATAALRSLGFADLLAEFHPFERGAEPVSTTFSRPGPGAGPAGLVDLHRSLPLLTVPEDIAWHALSAGSGTTRIAGAEVRVLGRTALALHVVLHAVQHRFDGHSREDLRRAIAAMPRHDWRPVADLAARLGVTAALGFGLRQEAAGIMVADGLGLPVRAPAESHYWLQYAPRGAQSLAEFWSAPTWWARVRQVRWILLPSPAKVRYTSGRPDARRRSLASAYARWWRGLARDIVPAARCANSRRRLARGGG